jgi:hypothetical protein
LVFRCRSRRRGRRPSRAVVVKADDVDDLVDELRVGGQLEAPFFFIRSGMSLSLPLVMAYLGLLGALLAVKLILKSTAVHPLARRYARHHAVFTTLLMSTGLTFGTVGHLRLHDGRDHQPGPVLGPAQRRRAHRSAAHRDRAAVLRPGRSRGDRCRRTRHRDREDPRPMRPVAPSRPLGHRRVGVTLLVAGLRGP